MKLVVLMMVKISGILH